MNQLLTLLIAYLPKLGVAAELLVKIPDAIESVKDVKELIEKITEILNRPGLLSVEQRKALDESIDKMALEPHQQPDAT